MKVIHTIKDLQAELSALKVRVKGRIGSYNGCFACGTRISGKAQRK